MLPSSLSFTFTKLEYDGGWKKEMGYVTERLVHRDKMSSQKEKTDEAAKRRVDTNWFYGKPGIIYNERLPTCRYLSYFSLRWQ